MMQGSKCLCLVCLIFITAGAYVFFLAEKTMAIAGVGIATVGFLGLLGLLFSGALTTLSCKYPRFQIRFGRRRRWQYCPSCGFRLVYRYTEEPKGWWCPACQESVERPSLSPHERRRIELERRNIQELRP